MSVKKQKQKQNVRKSAAEKIIDLINEIDDCQSIHDRYVKEINDISNEQQKVSIQYDRVKDFLDKAVSVDEINIFAGECGAHRKRLDVIKEYIDRRKTLIADNDVKMEELKHMRESLYEKMIVEAAQAQ